MEVLELDILTPQIKHMIENKVSNTLPNKKHERVFDALHLLLNGDYEKYTFNSTTLSTSLFCDYTDDNFQSLLSKINEKQYGREETGRFYTPKDVTEYIVANSYLNILDESQKNVYSTIKCISEIGKSQKVNDLIFGYSVFDPTCGTGEFLVTALNIKLSLLTNPTESDILNVLKTIHGNDINIVSVEISKIRLFFTILSYFKNYDKLNEVAEVLNMNFNNQDFLKSDSTLFEQPVFEKHNIIVGNPPYVEDIKSVSKPLVRYGNIYANVLENSVKLLKDNGVMGFVLPLSYVATIRMKKIRNLLINKTPKQLIINYADRPDCLFSGVHQKLTILICSNATEKSTIYTSGYNYWYKHERENLLIDKELVLVDYKKLSCIPKIANATEKSILDKVLANQNDNTILSLTTNRKPNNLFLNMRATFWIKAFSCNPGSKEYKGFHFEEKHQPYILSLLNSNLFFFFWTVISDCWHITNKELSSFKVILDNVDFVKFITIAKNLENKLEETKQYIGTKQTEYAYKHKFCKTEIDLVDNELANIYNLTTEEIDYVKKYQLKYRMSEK
ncbi:MAG TPA: N-6 DNA methylase [Bacteroidales bacterium]|jgi:type I restriction-modification system DNA methylase subunit|nr:N-6 DNA methylase [Bacteroidales bacterium]HQN23410.1 N-6 DNA methylase [Bacteroidales bacterium]HQP78627.1 N-6 DNA methylase [Bacteroidales bacterium]